MYIFFYIIYFYLGANIQKGQDPDPLSVLGVPSENGKKDDNVDYLKFGERH